MQEKKDKLKEKKKRKRKKKTPLEEGSQNSIDALKEDDFLDDSGAAVGGGFDGYDNFDYDYDPKQDLEHAAAATAAADYVAYDDYYEPQVEARTYKQRAQP